jgi:molybdate transport system substrate-binding protein
MLKKIILVLGLCASGLFAGTINVAVAANVSYAIDELIAKFNQSYPDTKVQVNLSSTGKLTAQIRNGAPYGILMGANMKYPEALYQDKFAITKPVIYAQGSLAMLSSKEQDFTKGIALVDEDKINKIAVANPKAAPYGKAAVEAIKNAGFLDKVQSKFVYAESISQTVTYATTAADIGFIAKSSLYSPKMKMYKKDVNWVDVDPKLYTPIDQGIVILKKAEGDKEVKAFYDFILSPDAKAIFQEYGYLVP